MARLPTPGGDNGNWGNILNDYLSRVHTPDGALKQNSVTSDAIAPNAVTAAAIAPNAVNAVTIANGSITNALIADGTIGETKLTSAVQTKLNNPAVADATSSTKGILQLAGDLGGTAAVPTLTATANVNSIIAANSTVTGKLDTATAAATYAPKASPTFTGTVTVPTPTNNTDAATKAYVDSAATNAAATLVFDARKYGVIADGAQHNNVANLIDCVSQCAIAGGGIVFLPAGTIVTSEAVMGATLTADSGRTYVNSGAIPLPIKTPIKVMGQGRNRTIIKLSAGFQRAFDFRFQSGSYDSIWHDVEICDMTVDKQNLTGVSIAPNTAVVTPNGKPTTITIPLSTGIPSSATGLEASVSDYSLIAVYADRASFPVTGAAGNVYTALDTGTSYIWSASTYAAVIRVWVTIPGLSGSTWKNAASTTSRSVFIPDTATGTLRGELVWGRVNPNNANEFQIIQGTSKTATLRNGDTLQGTLQYSHTIIGAQALNMNLDNLYVHDIDAVNVATRTDAKTSAGNYSDTQSIVAIGFAGRYYSSALSAYQNSSVTNVRIERCRGFGGMVGFLVGSMMSTIGTGSWMDNIFFYDCYHDSLDDWWLTGNHGGGSSFQFGGHCWTGRVGVFRCEGRRSSDVGFEVDHPWEAWEVDCVWRDCAHPVYTQSFDVPAETSTGPITSTLQSGIGSTDTSAVFILDTGGALGSGSTEANFVSRSGLALIDTELVWYQTTDSVGGATPTTSVTLWRHINNTTAATHSAGATVTFVETNKTRFHSIRSKIINTNGLPWDLGCFSSADFGIPQTPLTIRDATIINNGGWGNFLLLGGWRQDLDIQGCTFIQNRLRTEGPVDIQAAISVLNAGADLVAAGVPAPPPRIYGRNNRVFVDGRYRPANGAPDNYYAALSVTAGWHLIDWEMETQIELQRGGNTLTGTTAAVNLSPATNVTTVSSLSSASALPTRVYQQGGNLYRLMGFGNGSNDLLFSSGNHWVPFTNQLILAAGSRISTVARIPISPAVMYSDPSPISYRVASTSSVTTNGASLITIDPLGTLVSGIDSSQSGHVTTTLAGLVGVDNGDGTITC